jgi:hypothetical protein
MGKVSVSSGRGIECYFTEGFTPRFYENLERMSRGVYVKYFVDESEDFFIDLVRSKVEDRLMAGIYDARLSSFRTYLYRVIANEVTRINSKNKKRVCLGDHLDNVLQNHVNTSKPIYQQYLPDRHMKETSRDRFLDYARRRGIELCPIDLEYSLQDGRLGPSSFAYLWLLQKKAV